MRDYMTTREVTERLDIQDWDIENLIRRRAIPRPPVIGGVRIWSWPQFEALRDAIAQRDAKRCVEQERA